MVSHLKGTTYEEKLKGWKLTSLEERRHLTYLLTGYLRQDYDLLYLKQHTVRLDLRRKFFSIRANERLNMVPSEI
jgi:hypothetical protein